jgi:hypothetical protein
MIRVGCPGSSSFGAMATVRARSCAYPKWHWQASGLEARNRDSESLACQCPASLRLSTAVVQVKSAMAAAGHWQAD